MITSREYNTQKDYDNVYKFLSDIFDETKNFYAWDTGRWTFNRFCVHHSEELLGQRHWDQSVRIWEEHEKIIAVAHIEEPGDYFYHIKPGYESILEEMVKWSFSNALELDSDKSSIQVSAFHMDHERIKLYEQLGATKEAFVDDHRTLWIKGVEVKREETHRFTIKKIDCYDKQIATDMAQIYRNVWPESPYMASEEIISRLVLSPAYKDGEGFIAYNSLGEPLGFYILWLDNDSKHAHLYPFAIKENALNTELPRILLAKGIERLQEIGAELLTISAWYKPEEESVFKEFGFKGIGSTLIYKLPISGYERV